jgi:signal transduction histidine kinase
VQTMNTAVNACFKCHHTPDVVHELDHLKNQIEQYESALSRVFTMRANKSRLEAEEDSAFKQGMELISEVDDITTKTNRKLGERTQAALKDITYTKNMLYLILAAVPLTVLCLSIFFFRGFTRPVDVLVTATRQLKAGEFNFRIEGLQDEYGEVAAAFNEMASSLKEHYHREQWAEQIVVLGELAGGLAHEMNNPIAGIKGAIQVLSGDSSLSEKHRDILLKVIDQIERIEFLHKSLFNFAQPPKPNFLLINVNEAIEETISLAEKHPLFLLKKSRGITIVRNFDSRLPKTMADSVQLQQVFMNLLLNAADAMPNGGTLTAQTSHEKASPFLRITIKDTGSGIDNSMIDKIFQPFFTTKPKGTGLGLSITKRLIEQHGGSIHVANNPSGGTSFTIDLPIKEGEVTAA